MKLEEHRKSTLMAYSKEELADHCVALEQTNNALRQTFEIQYDNCLKMVNDMKILNDGLKIARSEGK